ncbi:hypothetical protein AMTR_s00008p00265090, partial [Amborella trichopoda]
AKSCEVAPPDYSKKTGTVDPSRKAYTPAETSTAAAAAAGGLLETNLMNKCDATKSNKGIISHPYDRVSRVKQDEILNKKEFLIGTSVKIETIGRKLIMKLEICNRCTSLSGKDRAEKSETFQE